MGEDKGCGNCKYGEEEESFCVQDNAPECTAPTFALWEPKEIKQSSVYTTQEFMMEESISNNNSRNNGGSTDYYIFPGWIKETQDLIEWRGMNFAQGNMCKAVCTFNAGRHTGTSYERELNKIIWYANRELERIRKEKS